MCEFDVCCVLLYCIILKSLCALWCALLRLGVKATTPKAKDLAFKAKAKDGVKANVNMVRCSVRTSKHRCLLQGW